MKKLIRILPLIAILSLSGCDFFQKDFFRNIAGRPTAGNLEEFKDSVLARREALADSISRVRKEAIRRENERRDSLEGVWKLTDADVRIAATSSFGQVVSDIVFRYNVVIGVFRQESTASSTFDKAAAKGYAPYYMEFEQGGVKAVCLMGNDSLSSLADSLLVARKKGECPAGAWVYVQR